MVATQFLFGGRFVTDLLSRALFTATQSSAVSFVLAGYRGWLIPPADYGTGTSASMIIQLNTM